MTEAKIKSIVEKTKKCYAKENTEPLLGFFIGDEYPNNRFPHSLNLPDDRPLVPEDFDIDLFIEDGEALYKEHDDLDSDLIWTATPFWGIPWIEAMLGLDIVFNKTTCSISANNNRGRVTLDTIPEFSLDNPWVVLMQKYFDAMNENCRNRYPMGTTRVRGLADILASIYGGQEFVIATLEEEDEIRAYLDKIVPFYIDMMNFQLRNIPDFYGGMGSFYYYNWVPHGTVWHQEDSVMLLSPDIYEDIFYEYDKKIYESFDHNICHFHSVGGYAPWEKILDFKPLALEMHIDFGGPSAQQLFETHKKIMEGTTLIIWGEFTEDDLDWVYNNLPPQGLILAVHVPNRERAIELAKKYRKH